MAPSTLPRRRAARAVALAALLLATLCLVIGRPMTPAQAATNQFKGVNWADTRDNFNTGWVIPDGLSASDSYATVYSIASNYIKAFEANLGANTVRLPINVASVSQSWWGSYRGAIDAALADGMKVILSYWSESSSVGTITDMTGWTAMWDTVVSDYGSNPNVYFEPMNEPHGYTLSQWVSICSAWLAAHPNIPRSRVIISGTGYNDNVTGVGAAAALSGTLLSLHIYASWDPSYTQESQWTALLNSEIGAYTGRTIIDEFGAPMTTGVNYLANHNGALQQSCLAAVTDLARADSMGSVYWAGLKTGDTFSMEAHSGSTLVNNNASGVTQVRWGWGY
jgi:Cellulase (glycosyl hydrolase family 5)